MPTNEFTDIQSIHDFKSLIKYLRKELNWPVDEEQADDLYFTYNAAELGIDERLAVKIREIKQLRPLAGNQPWGVFWIQFEQKQLPVVVMRRILSALVKKQRGRKGSQKTWDLPDLMFISATGAGNERGISFAHFQEVDGKPQLRTFAWDVKETHLYYIKNLNLNALRWPTNARDVDTWRRQWSDAFTAAHREVPRTAEMLAKKMAQIAGYIREAVELTHKMEHAGGSLHKLHLNLKLDLISDLSEDDFADMYAQTVTYGLFAARATRTGSFNSADATALIEHTNPFLRELLEQMMNQQSIDLDELGVTELTELLGKVNMEAILQDFGRQKKGEDPVIHFYETFMREYDPQQKTKRGEFYTPDAVVSFIVRSVDYLLRTEFDCPDGLATTSANAKGFQPVILDPATGTGTFLKYVIEVIWATFYEKNRKLSKADRTVKWNRFVRENVLPRLYAFELKMSPYTIAHMKVGLTLQEFGFEFQDGERLQIYLSNALQPAHEVARVDTPALAHEIEHSNEVKNSAPITVIIGNPPYSVSSFNTGEWITNLVKQFYYPNDETKEHNPKVILDDYVKFLRFAEWRIARTGRGLVGMITNHGYLDNATFRRMRQQLMKTYSEIYVLNLHGNAHKREVSPDGSKDENVFDILQGVSICFLVKKPENAGACRVFYSDLYGLREYKYEWMLTHHKSIESVNWQELSPKAPFYFFVPQNVINAAEYENGWKVTSIFPVNSTGIKTHRDHFVLGFDAKELEKRINDFRNASIPDSEIRNQYELPDTRDWKLSSRRRSLQSVKHWKANFTKCLYRPLDIRDIYYHDEVIELPRPEVMRHMYVGKNLGLITTRQTRDKWDVIATQHVCDHKSCAAYDTNSIFPLYLYTSWETTAGTLFATNETTKEPNISKNFVNQFSEQLKLRHISSGTGDLRKTFGPEDVFYYMYAVFHSPTYRNRYAEFLKIDFPRLPLTSNVELFRQLCGLGKALMALHLLEAPVLDKPITRFKGKGDNAVAKGHPKYQDGVVLVNPSQGFEGVPEEVWEFHIGGYQVCEKWLKDRRGRELSAEDIVHYQQVVVALKETIRLMKEVDTVINVHGGWPIK